MEKDAQLFGLSLEFLSKEFILFIGAFGIFISFLTQGYSQEKLYVDYQFREAGFLTLFQFLCYSLFSSNYIVRLVKKQELLHTSIPFFAITSFCLVCSMGLSNMSVDLLSYPTAVLFKSSKLIPVMIGGLIFLKKKYSPMEVASVLLMVCGLIGISYSDKVSKNTFDIYGVFLSILSLCFDAISSNLQEKALSQYGVSQSELISVMYLIGALFLFVFLVFTGQFQRGVRLCYETPQIFGLILIFGLLGSIGVQFVYLIMKVFGSLVTVMVTSTRKAFTICLSFLLFPNKKFTSYHFFSIFMIATALFMNYRAKNQKRNNDHDKFTSHYIVLKQIKQFDADNSDHETNEENVRHISPKTV